MRKTNGRLRYLQTRLEFLVAYHNVVTHMSVAGSFEAAHLLRLHLLFGDLLGLLHQMDRVKKVPNPIQVLLGGLIVSLPCSRVLRPSEIMA